MESSSGDDENAGAVIVGDDYIDLCVFLEFLLFWL